MLLYIFTLDLVSCTWQPHVSNMPTLPTLVGMRELRLEGA